MNLIRIEQPEDNYDWHLTQYELPEDGRLLDTKNEVGEIIRLIYLRGRWFLPDRSGWLSIKPKYWKYVRI